jgi:hypothetical protein
MLRRVALVRTDVSKECSASIITVTGIGELGTKLAVISNRRRLRRNTKNNILHTDRRENLNLTFSLCSSLNNTYQVLRPYRTTRNTIVLYNLIFKFFGSRREEGRFCTESPLNFLLNQILICCLSKESVQVLGSYESFVTNLVFIVRICKPHAQLPSWWIIICS